MTQSSGGFFDTESVTGLGWLAVVLALVTGVLHVYAGIQEGRIPVTLAGVGFFGAVVLYLADYRRSLLALVGVFYTGIQIPLWYVANSGEFTAVGYLDKAVQVVLVVVLAYLYWTDRTSGDDRREAPPAQQTG